MPSYLSLQFRYIIFRLFILHPSPSMGILWNHHVTSSVAQLLERWTGIAEVTGSNPVQAWIFVRLQFRNYLSCVCNCGDQLFLHLFLSSLNICSFIFHIYQKVKRSKENHQHYVQLVTEPNWTSQGFHVAKPRSRVNQLKPCHISLYVCSQRYKNGILWKPRAGRSIPAALLLRKNS